MGTETSIHISCVIFCEIYDEHEIDKIWIDIYGNKRPRCKSSTNQKDRTTEKKLEQINLPHKGLAVLIRDKMFIKWNDGVTVDCKVIYQFK
jgi:hypothetical protein